jgi:capsular exopolysaccharide synthesis family protein
VLAITSALPDEGKTTVSLCLARIAALSGKRVVLVDCDLRRQSLAKVLGASPKSGLLEVLTDKVQWQSAVCEDEETTAHFLMGSPSAFTPLDLFSSQLMAGLIGELRQAYDLVILDCAPVLQVAETRTAAALADISIIVVRADKTPTTAVRTAIRALRNSDAKVHGVTLNFVNPPALGRGAYYNSLYYGSASSKYYAG